MRVLFDQGVYDLRNMGNVALTQAAVERIRRRWPDATLEVMTSAPHLLRLYCRSARPISPDGDSSQSGRRGLLDAVASHSPLFLLRIVLELREEIRRRWPSLGRVLTGARPAAARADAEPNRRHAASRPGPAPHAWRADTPAERPDSAMVEGVDLLIATGAQYMSDACRDNAHRVLDRLETASRHGALTAMVGQGFGPFEDPELRAHARRVLPLVDAILVRDAKAGVELLHSLGVRPERVAFTADDAIEMAYRSAPAALGTCIGIGLRVAQYTGVSAEDLGRLRQVLRDAAAKRHCRLLPLPISGSLHERDDRVLRRLVNGHAMGAFLGRNLQSPIEIVKRVGKCRIVVTGSFHPAVFALSQGIPVVGLARSPMYLEKFLSLVDQFGPGCQMVRLDDEKLGAALAHGIDTAWRSAEQLRPRLLEAAARLVKLGNAGYQRLFDLVESGARRRIAAC